MFKTSVFLCFLGLYAGLSFSASIISQSGGTPLYGTFEAQVSASGVSGNKFTKYPAFTFSNGGDSYDVDGFYNNNDVWKVRFMPAKSGTWNYTWSFEGSSGSGSFSCTSTKVYTEAHGHVHRDPAHPRYLAYDDGTPHYWFGGKWISTNEYGPLSKGGETNTGQGDNPMVGPTTDAQFTAYLNQMQSNRHNGLLLKIRLYPLESDRLSWDVNGWLTRAEWLLSEMGKRGIYCQINIFGTWGRCKDSWFDDCTAGGDQVFNVWASGDETYKEAYIRYLMARFAGFYNVYWELGNEMEHSPNSGSSFVSQANGKYIPWIKQYDPYGLPIGLSEGVWTSANVDIGFLHQTGSLTPENPSGNRPTIMNELVGGCSTGSLWRDEVMRNGAARVCYRRTFWQMFTYGGCGSSEATWLKITTALDADALNVMGDQKRLRDFLDEVPVSPNEMDRAFSVITSGPGSHSCRAKAGAAYACYFLGSAPAGNAVLNLPAGQYSARWYTPSTGAWSPTVTVSGSGGTSIPYASFSNDIALLVVNSGAVDTTPPLPPAGLRMINRTSNSISLSWSAPAAAPDGDSATDYIIRRGGVSVAVVTGTSYTDIGLDENTAYGYEIVSRDDMQNVSTSGATGSYTTLGDQTAPALVSVTASGEPDKVTVVFSEPLESASASTAANYTISPSIPVASAALQTNAATVVLTTAQAHLENVTYTLAVSNVRDASASHNVIAAGASKTYQYTSAMEVSAINLVASTRTYAYDTLRAGVQYYTDRTFTVSSPVPSSLNGQLMIKTPNDDKNSDVGTLFTITVNVAVTVYICVDSRGAADANWMDAYEPAGMTLATSDVALTVYQRTAGPGEISFGGNHDAGNLGALSNYIVVLVPATGGGPVIHQRGKSPAAPKGLGAYPNPFNPEVVFTLGGKVRSGAVLDIFDTAGRHIERMAVPQDGRCVWNAAGRHSGLYIAHVRQNGRVYSRKVILSR